MLPIRRILTEKRTWLWPLGAIALLNLGAAVFVLYPLSLRVDAAAARAGSTTRTVQQAERQLQAAEAARDGKDRADEELGRFYAEVLPKDQTGARRITYLRLAQMAQQSNLRYERRSIEQDQERGSTLTKMQMRMVLDGRYSDVRRFIHSLETSNEFVVIQNIELVQQDTPATPLKLTLDLATYYQVPDGS